MYKYRCFFFFKFSTVNLPKGIHMYWPDKNSSPSMYSEYLVMYVCMHMQHLIYKINTILSYININNIQSRLFYISPNNIVRNNYLSLSLFRALFINNDVTEIPQNVLLNQSISIKFKLSCTIIQLYSASALSSLSTKVR